MKRLVRIYLRLWKLWKAVGSKEKYLDTERKERQIVCTAKRNAEEEKFASITDNKENIFCVTKQIRAEYQAVIGEKWMRGDDDNFSLNYASKKLAWKEHY